MEPGYFGILGLPRRIHSRREIDRRYRSVRREILRDGGPDKQRRLDEALVARVVLQDPGRQKVLIRRLGEVETPASRGAAGRRRVASRVIPAPTVRPGPAPRSPRPMRTPAPGPRVRREDVRVEGGDGDRHKRFAAMVAQRAEAGLLRMTERRRLMAEAESMGVGEFKANLIIAEVLHELRLGRRVVARDVQGSPVITAPAGEADARWLDVILAAVVATAVNIGLLIWLIG